MNEEKETDTSKPPHQGGSKEIINSLFQRENKKRVELF